MVYWSAFTAFQCEHGNNRDWTDDCRRNLVHRASSSPLSLQHFQWGKQLRLQFRQAHDLDLRWTQEETSFAKFVPRYSPGNSGQADGYFQAVHRSYGQSKLFKEHD